MVLLWTAGPLQLAFLLLPGASGRVHLFERTRSRSLQQGMGTMDNMGMSYPKPNHMSSMESYGMMARSNIASVFSGFRPSSVLNLACDELDSVNGDVVSPAEYTNFAIAFNAKRKKDCPPGRMDGKRKKTKKTKKEHDKTKPDHGKDNGNECCNDDYEGVFDDKYSLCQVDPLVVEAYFQPAMEAAFLAAVEKAIEVNTGKPISADPFGVKICTILGSQFDWTCHPQCPDTQRALARSATKTALGRQAADKKIATKPITNVNKQLALYKRFKPANFWQIEQYHTRYVAYISVFGIKVADFLDVITLNKIVTKEINQKLKDKYKHSSSCYYDVEITMNPTFGPIMRRVIDFQFDHNEGTLGTDDMTYDGYPYTGSFYYNGTRLFGPTIDAYENDLIAVNIRNFGVRPQATHWHGLDVTGFPYNDGATGFSQGTLTTGNSYTYTFRAHPTGSTWYHGHVAETLLAGNRGLMIIRKRPCNDPYGGMYDEERYLGFTESMPWNTSVEPLRHVTADEDAANFFAGVYGSILTDAGTTPTTDMPWAGVLINGIGRSSPQFPDGAGEVINGNEPKGQYFQMPVEQGKTYRVRLLGGSGNQGYRVKMANHTMHVISVSGADIAPFEAPEAGIELQPGDRYDVLVTWNQAHDSKHLIEISSPDGCYQAAAWVLYDSAQLNPDDIKSADEFQSVRRCDQECYDSAGTNSTAPNVRCNVYKAFSTDQYFTKLTYIEPDAVPPPNDGNDNVVLTIKEGDVQFIMNDVEIPVIKPPLYQIHAAQNQSFDGLDPNSTAILSPWLFSVGQVVDWCVVSYTSDRHPMHMHANRFWVLGAGDGDASACVTQVDDTKPTAKVDILNMQYANATNPTWIKFRNQIVEVGSYPFHCHIEYHIYKVLAVPVISGPNDRWPAWPADLPLGPYNTY